MKDKARWVVLIAVIVLFIAGATTVYVVASNNRSDDREAVLAYESRVLAQVREMNVLSGSMLDFVDSFKSGKLKATALAQSARMWADRFLDVAQRLAAVQPPVAIGTGEPMFEPAARHWATAANLYATFASCAENPNQQCIKTGQDADASAQRALGYYRRARTALLDARSRLGLGDSPNFPESPPR